MPWRVRSRRARGKAEKVIVARNPRTGQYIVMHYDPDERPPCMIIHATKSKRQAMKYARQRARTSRGKLKIEDRTKRRKRKR